MQKLAQKWQKVKNLVVGDKIAVPREEVLARHKSTGSLDVKTGLRPVSDVGARFSRPSVGANNYSSDGTGDGEPLRKTEGNVGSGDVQWDEIVSIEKVGEEQVYDIEVDSTHNFVGNDIFAHNTYLGNLEVEKQARENEINSLKVANVAQDEAIDQTELAVESLDSRLDTVESTSLAYSTELDKLKQELAELQGSGSSVRANNHSPVPAEVDPNDTSGSPMDPAGVGTTGTGSVQTTDSGVSPAGEITSPNNTGESTSPLQTSENNTDIRAEIAQQILALDLSAKLQGDVLNNLSLKNLTVLADATFAGDLKVDGHIVAGEDTAGEIVIKAGEFETMKDENGLPVLDDKGNEQPLLDEFGQKVPILTAKVEFKKPYTGTPIVTVTPVGDAGLDPEFRYAITEKTSNGFTVKISKAMSQDVKFDWHVFESLGMKP